MTRLLISARSAAEAKIVASAGVDIVDIKEPLNGALGLASPDTLKEVVDSIPLSVNLSVILIINSIM